MHGFTRKPFSKWQGNGRSPLCSLKKIMLAHKIVATRTYSTEKPQNLNLCPKFIEKQRDLGWLKMVKLLSGNDWNLENNQGWILCKNANDFHCPLFFTNMVTVSKTIFIVGVIFIISADFLHTELETCQLYPSNTIPYSRDVVTYEETLFFLL